MDQTKQVIVSYKAIFQEGEYLHNVCLMNSRTGKLFYDKIGFKFLELPNFNKKAEELTDNIDKWFYLLKNMRYLDKIPASLDTPLFQKIFKIAEIANLTQEERMLYNSNLKAKWDYENTIAYAEEVAENKGEIKTKNTIAAALKKTGMPIEEISSVTKLTAEEIESI